MSEKKKSHGVQLLLRAVVTDPDGKVISDTGEKPANSFVIQFLEFIHSLFRGPGGWNVVTATNGTEDPIYWGTGDNPQKEFKVDSVAGEHRYGVVVGTGDTAESNTDYKLQTQLTEGATAGKITHGTTVVGTAGVAGANVDMEVKRSFTNNTGSAITVKEAGIYTHNNRVAPTGSFHCIIRDVFPGPVNVPNYCSLAVYYTLRTTV